MELRSFASESRAGSSSSSTQVTSEFLETSSGSSVLASSIRGASTNSRSLEHSPFRRVRFDLDSESDGSDSNNVATQTEGGFIVGRYVSNSSAKKLIEDIRTMGKSFWNSSSVKSISEYVRELDERPKTGYTYASSLSYDLCGDPDPPMPNMSRHSLDYYAVRHRQGHSSSISTTTSSTRNGSDSRWWSRKTRNSVSLDVPVLDFSQPSSPRPEPSSALRRNLSSLYRKMVNLTTTTTTVTTTSVDQNDSGLEESSSGGGGRITPESRSGNDRAELMDATLSSTISGKSVYQNGYHGELNGFQRSGIHKYSTSQAPMSVFELVRKRFIDIVNRTTTTVTNSEDYLDRRKRRRTCPLWPFCLLLMLLPLLGLFWWSPGEVGNHIVQSVKTVGSSIYGSFLPFLMMTSRNDSSSVLNVTTKNTSSDGEVRIVHVPCDLSNLPMPKSCCEDVDLIKSQVAVILAKLDNMEKQTGDRTRWMDEREAIFSKTQVSMEELRAFLFRLEKEITIKREIVPNVVRERESFTIEDIRILIARMIRRYDEDKTGEPDHALESAGATVISTRCTEEHKWGYAQYSLFGIPLWSWTTSPRLAIQDGVKPGQCWAFKGDQGYLVIKLAGLVRPTSFTLEHLSKNLSPTGRIDSAPKDFEVLGLMSEQGPAISLGKYVYEDNDEPLQNFQVQTKLEENEIFPFVELKILSNHGNPEYTCLYRFRVHGNLLQRGH